jgi:large subunit ribosomal protein L30e
MVEAGTEIRRAVDTGKVLFGYKQCQKELMKGKGELIVLSKNIPEIEKETIKHLAETAGKKVFEYPKNGLNLGSICGKPFVISSLIIIDTGKSKVLDLMK